VHQCLRFNRNKISDRCREEEMKLAAVEYRDIRLRPRLNKLCSEERAVYCKVKVLISSLLWVDSGKAVE
jgi:Golgi apparatus protein 1